MNVVNIIADDCKNHVLEWIAAVLPLVACGITIGASVYIHRQTDKRIMRERIDKVIDDLSCASYILQAYAEELESGLRLQNAYAIGERLDYDLPHNSWAGFNEVDSAVIAVIMRLSSNRPELRGLFSHIKNYFECICQQYRSGDKQKLTESYIEKTQFVYDIVKKSATLVDDELNRVRALSGFGTMCADLG